MNRYACIFWGHPIDSGLRRQRVHVTIWADALEKVAPILFDVYQDIEELLIEVEDPQAVRREFYNIFELPEPLPCSYMDHDVVWWRKGNETDGYFYKAERPNFGAIAFGKTSEEAAWNAIFESFLPEYQVPYFYETYEDHAEDA